MDDLISRQAAKDMIKNHKSDFSTEKDYRTARACVNAVPPAQPEQLEQCPIYGGMCAYPPDQCYDCPRHAGAKMGVTS